MSVYTFKNKEKIKRLIVFPFIILFIFIILFFLLFSVGEDVKAWDDGLLEYWSFDDGLTDGEILGESLSSQGTVLDEMYSGGYANEINYTNHFTNNSFDFESGLTFSWWVNYNNNQASSGYVRYLLQNSGDDPFDLKIGPHYDNAYWAQMVGNDDWSWPNVQTDNKLSNIIDLNADKYYHHILIMDNETVKIYVDNKLLYEADYGSRYEDSDFQALPSSKLYIMNNSSGDDEVYRFDEIMLFDYPLNNDERNYLYNLDRPLDNNDNIGVSDESNDPVSLVDNFFNEAGFNIFFNNTYKKKYDDDFGGEILTKEMPNSNMSIREPLSVTLPNGQLNLISATILKNFSPNDTYFDRSYPYQRIEMATSSNGNDFKTFATGSVIELNNSLFGNIGANLDISTTTYLMVKLDKCASYDIENNTYGACVPASVDWLKYEVNNEKYEELDKLLDEYLNNLESYNIASACDDLVKPTTTSWFGYLTGDSLLYSIKCGIREVLYWATKPKDKKVYEDLFINKYKYKNTFPFSLFFTVKENLKTDIPDELSTSTIATNTIPIMLGKGNTVDINLNNFYDIIPFDIWNKVYTLMIYTFYLIFIIYILKRFKIL